MGVVGSRGGQVVGVQGVGIGGGGPRGEWVEGGGGPGGGWVEGSWLPGVGALGVVGIRVKGF